MRSDPPSLTDDNHDCIILNKPLSHIFHAYSVPHILAVVVAITLPVPSSRLQLVLSPKCLSAPYRRSSSLTSHPYSWIPLATFRLGYSRVGIVSSSILVLGAVLSVFECGSVAFDLGLLSIIFAQRVVHLAVGDAVHLGATDEYKHGDTDVTSAASVREKKEFF